MVHPSEESRPYIFEFFDHRDFGDHRTNEHHGELTVPEYLLGTLKLLREERGEAMPCLSLGSVVEPQHEVANVDPTGMS